MVKQAKMISAEVFVKVHAEVLQRSPRRGFVGAIFKGKLGSVGGSAGLGRRMDSIFPPSRGRKGAPIAP